MSSIAVSYSRRVKKDSRLYYAQWLPTATAELGQIGKLVDGAIFVPKTTLAQQGIQFDIADDQAPSQLDLSSSRDVKVIFKIAGETNDKAPSIPKASAGVVLEFGREASYVIKAEEAYEPRIANVAALEREVLKRVRERTWDPDWVVISQVVRTTKADILISESSSSRVEITAKGGVPAGTVIELGSVSAEFAFTSMSGKVFNFLNARDVTPVFQLVGLRRRLLGGTSVGTLKSALAADSVMALDSDGLAEREEAGELYLSLLD